MARSCSRCRSLRLLLQVILLSTVIPLLLLTPGRASGEVSALKIRLLSPASVEAEPRKMLTVSFSVENASGSPVEVEAVVKLPPNWYLVGTPDFGTVAAGESRIGFATVSMPVDAAAGDYELVLEACIAGSASVATAGVTVSVLPYARIVLRPERLQETTIAAGESYTTAFTVANHGNAAATVVLELESRPQWKASVQPAEVELQPGEAATVTVAVDTPDDLYDTVRHRLTLTARVPGVAAGETEARASVTTQVVPRRRRPGSMYASLDGSLRLAADNRSGDEVSAQFELGLEGKLSATGTGRIELVGPILPGNRGAFSQQQRVLLCYEDTERGFLRLGDTSFDLGAPLISRSLPGRGVDLGVLAQSTEFRAFYNRGRFSRDAEGLQLSHYWAEDAVVRATALRTSEPALPGGARTEGRATLYSLYGDYVPFPGAQVEAEAADSTCGLEGLEDTSGRAYRVAGGFRNRMFSLDGEIVRADPGFAGAWQDTSIQRFSLSLSPLPDFRVWAYLNRSQRNLDRDPARSAPEENSVTVGAALNLGHNANLRVSRRESRREDLTLRTFDQRETTTDYQLTARFNRLDTSLSWQQRKKNDELTGTSEVNDRLRLAAALKLSPRASLRADFTREDSRDGSAGRDESQDQLSLRADLQLRDDLRLDLGYQQTKRSLLGSSSWMDGTITWQMPQGRELGLSFRRRSGAFGGETAIALEFMLPLSVPLPMLPQSGSLEGQLCLPGEPPEPLPGVRVAVDGSEVVTDANGRFVFPSLSPGEHQLTISLTSLGSELVPAVQLPLTFTAEPGVVTSLEIPIIRAAAVSGRVLRVTEEYGRRGKETVSYADVLLELQSESETLYRVTDSGGRFTFTGIPPGVWKLAIWSGALPAYYEVTPTEQVLDLGGGETRSGVDFMVAPVEREIEVTTKLD